MSDRVRIGELLAAIGAVGLSVLLAFGAWFQYDVVAPTTQDPVALSAGVTSKALGWFALLVVLIAAVAGLVALVRTLTAETSERPMLQYPVSYATALFALIVAAVRMILFTPDTKIDLSDVNLPDTKIVFLDAQAIAPTEIALGGWLALLALLLIVIGSWIALGDERKDTAAAKARTAALLDPIPVRPAPPAVAAAAPASDATVVADDQLPDPSDSTTPSTGDSA
ncbi:MAG: hypothetical protein PGN13_10990 [Patulibacter minatonensis]